MKNRSAEVDRYIEKAAPFAQPILKRIRDAFHKAQPEIQEVMKWSVPHFDYKGTVGSMAAFKQHVRWGFWKSGLMKNPHNVDLSMGGAPITDVSDLPSEKILVELVREAVRLNEEGVKVQRIRKPKPEAEVPSDLQTALKKSAAAQKQFKAFSPSQRREYVEWLDEAKQEATRQKRLTQAIEWIAEGKPRNWKYMKN